MADRMIKRKDRKARSHPVEKRSYSAEQVAEALGSRFYGPPSGDEQSLYCPVCEDPATSKSASASVNLAELFWWCHTRGKEPDHHISLDSLVQQFTSFDAAPTGQRSASAGSVARPVPELKPLENQDRPYEWHDQMMQKYPDRLEYLKTQRGLTVETIERFKIGWDGKRYTIPVRPGLGPWVNVRRYLRGAEQKMLNLKGHGRAALAFTETLSGNTLPVLVTEGEWDALLAWQQLEGRCAVVTGTGGASGVPRDLSALAGREVFVCYDNDRPGREGARKFAERALRAGAIAAHVLDVRELNVEHFRSGGDLSDAFFGGSTGSDVLDLMEKAQARSRNTTRFRVFSAAELAEPVPPMDWLVRGVWPAGSYGVIGGEKKSLKTYTTLSLALAVASGQPLFGRFTVPEPRRVLMYLGEGGRAPTQRRLHRLAKTNGVDLAALPLGMSFEAGNVLGDEFADAFARACSDDPPGLVILDPLYAFHPPGVEAQNLYDRGAMLAQVQALMPEGSALMIVDHFRKGIAARNVDLDAIAQSGMAQWSDSWLLQWHESPPAVDLGEFHIGMQFGSRQWGGGQYVADWQIGSFDADAGEHAGPLSVELRNAEWGTERAKGNSGKRAELARAILEMLTAEPLVQTKTSVRAALTVRLSVGKNAVDEAWAELEEGRRIVSEKADGPGGMRDRWRITTPAESKFRLNGAPE